MDLKDKLVQVPEDVRQMPDLFHARTGHVLPAENSNVHKQLIKTLDYATANEMEINYKKTKAITFNPCTSVDFSPEISLNHNDLEVVDEVRLLGLIITSDLKWASNTNSMVSKANKRIWIVRRLKFLGAEVDDLLEIYTKQIRSVLELAVPGMEPSP